MGQCRAECRIFRVLNCESNFLKYISAVVQKNVIPLNAEMTFFWFIRLERTFDKMKGHGVHQVFTPMKTKRMNRHVHELFVPCVRAAWL